MEEERLQRIKSKRTERLSKLFERELSEKEASLIMEDHPAKANPSLSPLSSSFPLLNLGLNRRGIPSTHLLFLTVFILIISYCYSTFIMRNGDIIIYLLYCYFFSVSVREVLLKLIIIIIMVRYLNGLVERLITS